MNEDWLKFRFSEAFPQSNLIGNWIAGVCWAANDLQLALGELRRRGVPGTVQDPAEGGYFFWLTCAHYREAAKLLHNGLSSTQIVAFMEKNLSREAQELMDNYLRPSFEPWEGSFVQKIAKPLRDGFIHYPDPSDAEWEAVWDRLSSYEGGVRRRGPRIGDVRAVFADDVRVTTISGALGEEDPDIGQNLRTLKECIAAFGRIADESLSAYLKALPLGVVKRERPQSGRLEKRRI